MANIHFLGDAVQARFLMVNNIIERGGHAVQVLSKPMISMLDGRVWFEARDLEAGDMATLNLHPEVWVQLGTDI